MHKNAEITHLNPSEFFDNSPQNSLTILISILRELLPEDSYNGFCLNSTMIIVRILQDF